MTPEVRRVANALLAAQCPEGVCVRDVTDHDPTLRMRLERQARNLLDHPDEMVAALLGVVSWEGLADEAAAAAREGLKGVAVPPLLAAQMREPRDGPPEVLQTADPFHFIVGGISVHNFADDPDFADDPRRGWLWGNYLPGPGWTAGFATMMDAYDAARATLEQATA